MKKLALLIVLILALSLTLAACNQAEKTGAIPRWSNGEKWTFTISKTDLENSSAQFNGETYLREPIAGGYEWNFEIMDQIVPQNVGGTYTMEIKLSADERECTYRTVQNLYLQYETDYLQKLPIWNDLKKLVADSDADNPLPKHDGWTTLKSVTENSVVFKNESSQRPLSSENHVDGFYLGKIQQNISKYDMFTNYDWGKNEVTVKINGEESKRTVKPGSVNLIDANQILLYARSLEKTGAKFQDSPKVQIYMPYTGTLTTASFAFTYACKTVLRGNDGQDVFAKLNALAVIIDGSALFVQINLPDTVNKDGANLDTISSGGETPLNRYTTLRFRSGYFSYQLASYKQEILDAVRVKAE